MPMPQISDQQLQLFLQVELAKEHFNLILSERCSLWVKHFHQYFLSLIKENIPSLTESEEKEIREFMEKHIIPTLFVDILAEKVSYLVQLKLKENEKPEQMPTEIFYQFPLTSEQLLLSSWETHRSHLEMKMKEFSHIVMKTTEELLHKNEAKKKSGWLNKIASSIQTFLKRVVGFFLGICARNTSKN